MPGFRRPWKEAAGGRSEKQVRKRGPVDCRGENSRDAGPQGNSGSSNREPFSGRESPPRRSGKLFPEDRDDDAGAHDGFRPPGLALLTLAARDLPLTNPRRADKHGVLFPLERNTPHEHHPAHSSGIPRPGAMKHALLLLTLAVAGGVAPATHESPLAGKGHGCYFRGPFTQP